MIENIKSLVKSNRWLYWFLRGIRFKDEDEGYQAKLFEQHDLIKQKVFDLNPQTVLEIGCGFGRNIKFLIEDCKVAPEKITGIDFSKTMLMNARKYLKEYLPKVELKNGSVLDIPFGENQFDLVLVHGVFMHIDPENLTQAIKETYRVCAKCVIQVEEFDFSKLNQKSNDYTFIHDYEKSYLSTISRDVLVTPLKSNPKLIFFELEKKSSIQF